MYSWLLFLIYNQLENKYVDLILNLYNEKKRLQCSLNRDLTNKKMCEN